MRHCYHLVTIKTARSAAEFCGNRAGRSAWSVRASWFETRRKGDAPHHEGLTTRRKTVLIPRRPPEAAGSKDGHDTTGRHVRDCACRRAGAAQRVSLVRTAWKDPRGVLKQERRILCVVLL